MNLLCHCGNVTSIGQRVPNTSPSRLKGHCLACRCDEHAYAHATPSNELPGCGPLCIHRPLREQRAVVAALESRDVSPDLAAYYKRMEFIEL